MFRNLPKPMKPKLEHIVSVTTYTAKNIFELKFINRKIGLDLHVTV